MKVKNNDWFKAKMLEVQKLITKKIDSIISLYNYIALTFLQEPDIDYSYIKTDGLHFEFDQNYSNTINATINLCNNFNDNIEINEKRIGTNCPILY